MSTLLALSLVCCQQQPACYDVPLQELELAAGAVLPHFDSGGPWEYYWESKGLSQQPWAVLDGPGEVVYVFDDVYGPFWSNRPRRELGELFVRTETARDLTGTLFVPKVQGQGFLRLPFRIPAAKATSNETDFRCAQLQRYRHLSRAGVPGGAWFRHRLGELRAVLGPALQGSAEEVNWRPVEGEFRQDGDALELFTGGRALFENLQLQRGLPRSEAGEPSVPLDSIEGISVRAIDWKPLLGPGEPKLDALAALIPADQHALFFPSFDGLTRTLDEADRLLSFLWTSFEERPSDAESRQRSERQLCLELSALSRALGPLVIESVALTGSDAYLRTGSDLALLFRAKAPDALESYVSLRQDGALRDGAKKVEGQVGGVAYRGVVSPTRSVSSYLARIGGAVVVANSLVPLERIAAVAAKQTPALAETGEYRYFRQRYVIGAADESALLVLSDATIRRWCSPRWRIGAARVVRAAAALAEEQAEHLQELLVDFAGPHELGPDADWPELGALTLTSDGVHSPVYGTLDFLTPIAELTLDRVSQREAELYHSWREGYSRAWSNFFDPIAVRVSLGEKRTGLDLTIRPLILGTEYSELRAMTKGPGLVPGSGDPHADALVHFAMGIDPEWELLRTAGMSLGPAAGKLGADLTSWLGGWIAIYLDDSPLWDELLAAENVDEILEGLGEQPGEIPLAVSIGVSNPLKLALFLTSLRAFVDGTAPGMTEWKDRAVGERRFVQIGSPGLGGDFSLFYTTTPAALILSLNEATLLRAMERSEQRSAASPPAGPAWLGSDAQLELRGRGFQLLELLMESSLGLRQISWLNLPILNEWKRLFPERDPVELHRRIFREHLECPGGGTYVWNAEWGTMESSVFGHPGAPRSGPRWPPEWTDITRAAFGLTFEEDGLRARGELERK